MPRKGQRIKTRKPAPVKPALPRSRGREAEVRFGQTLPLGRTATGSNTFTLPLRARYAQTQAGRVGAGNAAGTATFTIKYD